jgi:hypothetical protein
VPLRVGSLQRRCAWRTSHSLVPQRGLAVEGRRLRECSATRRTALLSREDRDRKYRAHLGVVNEAESVGFQCLG